jgi:hypothetical protein
MDESQKVLREQAWGYFGIVAAQRLTVLNFYIALSTLIAGAQFVILQNRQLSQAGAFLSLLLVFLSYIFWKWDKRSCDMIKIAEETLRYFENTTDFKDEDGVPHMAKLLNREEYMTSQKKKRKNSILFWRNYYTYRTCLNMIFWSFALTGIVGVVLYFI